MPKYETLIRSGPFRGIDASTADTDASPEDANFSSNIDTQRYVSGMVTARGRINLGALTGGNTVTDMDQMALTPTIRNTIVSLSNNSAAAFNPDVGPGATQTVIASGVGFTGIEQFGSQLFTNSGQQFYATGGTIINQAASWQFDSAANGQSYQFTIVNGPPFLAAQTYYYAVANIYTINALGISQQASPHGAFLVNGSYPNTVGPLNPSSSYIQFTTTSPGGAIWQSTLFGGTVTADTAIYRQSTNQPIWVLVASSKTGLGGNYVQLVNGTVWNDQASDAAIAANPQLDLYRDVPPVSPSNQGVIFTHMNRMWNFVVVQNA
ncbi:MAG: hypothetical protein WCC64_01610, partial [Aliidongia sp.]